MPTIHQVNFDAGKLRCGTGNNVHDRFGYPIISMGHIRGDSSNDPVVQGGDDPVAPGKRYRITITATQDGHNKEWKGRIVAPDSQNGGWIFAVVATKNDSDASAVGGGEGDLVVTVTVTNPSGVTSPGYTPPSPVPVASIP
jgi:hypothetical protein